MRSALLLTVLALTACHELPEPDQSGAHLLVAADPGLELCGGSLAHMDLFIERLAAEFSLAAPTGDDRVILYWLESERFDERTPCGRATTACARDDLSFSPFAPLNHELVHNLAVRVNQPLPVFTEGIAVAYEGLENDLFSFDDTSRDLHHLLTIQNYSELLRSGGYPTAGAFTTYLVQAHGIEAYLNMFAAVGSRESVAGVDTIFRDEFGVSLDDSIAAYAASDVADCEPFERDAKLAECAAPELEWDRDRLALHRSIACDQDDAVGPYQGDSVVVFHTVTIPADGVYAIAVVGDDPRNLVSLQPCTICGRKGVVVGGSPRTVALAAGRHSLRLHGPASTRTSVGLRIERVGSLAP